jgi:hypothetical protein
MVLSLLFGGLTLLAQEPKITLEIPGARLVMIKPQLERALGGPILLGKSIENDTIILHAVDVSPSDLRAKLAHVYNATWTKDGEGWQFLQSPTQKKEEKRLSIKLRSDALIKSYARIKKRLDKMQPFDADFATKMRKQLELLSKSAPRNENSYDYRFWMRVQQVDREGPFNRFGSRLLSRLPIEMFLSVDEDNKRAVYSNNPTSLQLPLRVEYQDLYQQLVSEQNVWSDATKSQPIQGPSTSWGGFSYLGNSASKTEPLNSRPGTMHIAVENMYGNLNVTVKMFNDKGITLFENNLEVSDSSLFDMYYDDAEIDKMMETAFTPEKKPEIKLSPRAKEFEKLFSWEDRKILASPELLNSISQPENNDPVSFLTSEIFQQYAPTKNLIARPPDDMVFNTYMIPQTTFGLKRFEFSQDDKWVIFKPNDPNKWRNNSLNRNLLGQLMRYAKDSKDLSLEEEASFVAAQPRRQDLAMLYQQFIRIVRNGEKMPIYNDDASLRIFSTLSKDIVKKASGENGLSYQQLSDATKEQIRLSIYDSNRWESRLEFDYEEFNKGGNTDWRVANDMQNLLYNGVLSEITSALPGGIPGNSNFKVTDATNAQLWVASDESSRYQGNGQMMSPNELGQKLFRLKYPDKYPWENNEYNRLDLSKIRLVSKRSVNVKLKLGKLAKNWSLTEAKLTDKGIYSSSTLPDEIKKEITKGTKEAKDQDKYYQSGGYRENGATPPPLFNK